MKKALTLLVVITAVLITACTPKHEPVNGCEIRPETECSKLDLSEASLSEANMRQSDLSGANLTDADLSTPIEEFSKLESAVMDGSFRVAVGSRDMEGSRVEVHQSQVRENSGRLFNQCVRLLFPLKLHDTQCGFKLFSMQQCRKIFELQQLERFAFDVEILFIAHKLGLPIGEIPIVWRHAEDSTLSFFKDGPRMLWDLLKIRWFSLTGRYALAQ